MLDEPPTCLHLDDVRVPLEVLQALVDRGDSVVGIEHHMDVVKSPDWIVDMVASVHERISEGLQRSARGH